MAWCGGWCSARDTVTHCTAFINHAAGGFRNTFVCGFDSVAAGFIDLGGLHWRGIVNVNWGLVLRGL